ncbi:hypothetical protein G6F57_013603 [Rhizopus arrhizus]|nr:hypothetical protein G6F30_012362 [Rhizopus arrhizus]KAG0973901.1 hypothetical protein G6F29_012554 [Rhizopus arrhizus]KAG0977902.1 hypothetical protein G6F28_012279 [Rhizopus arrhizus]KAG1001879.1 hypothetical protein G6F27_012468 [Rhizopus arrhizus]KAG1016523.1 hypothetical protein G6F26_012460 [Rhizopus arrhizus]
MPNSTVIKLSPFHRPDNLKLPGFRLSVLMVLLNGMTKAIHRQLHILAFPSLAPKSQLLAFLDDVVLKIQSTADTLSQRSLSILGRSLVVNYLILSRIWHAIRILAVPPSFFASIRSVIIQFLKQRSFPAVSFDTCQRPRKEGGLSILDPATQHAALQLRWLTPLLEGASDESSPAVVDCQSFVPNILQHCLRTFSEVSSHILPLVFPETRTPAIKSFGCFRSLFRSFDQIGFGIDWSSFNATMVLELPLNRICDTLNLYANGREHSLWFRILVKHVYTIDPPSGLLKRKPVLPRARFRNSILRYAELIQNQAIRVHDFFLPFTEHQASPSPAPVRPLLYPPPIPDFHRIISPVLPDGTLLLAMTTKWFRSCALSPLEALSAHYPTGSSAAWNRFWRSSFPQRAHTILWRLYHHKLPCRARLHRLIPSRITDEHCVLCGGIDDDEHFLWSCPSKRPFWNTLASRFLRDPPSLQYDYLLMNGVRKPQLLSDLKLSPFDLIGCAILALWQAHRMLYNG